MIEQIRSIPVIFKAILTAFLTIIAIYVTYPIANIVLGLFTDDTMMKYVAIMIYWLIIMFVTWVLLWVEIFKVPKQQDRQEV